LQLNGLEAADVQAITHVLAQMRVSDVEKKVIGRVIVLVLLVSDLKIHEKGEKEEVQEAVAVEAIGAAEVAEHGAPIREVGHLIPVRAPVRGHQLHDVEDAILDPLGDADPIPALAQDHRQDIDLAPLRLIEIEKEMEKNLDREVGRDRPQRETRVVAPLLRARIERDKDRPPPKREIHLRPRERNQVPDQDRPRNPNQNQNPNQNRDQDQSLNRNRNRNRNRDRDHDRPHRNQDRDLDQNRDRQRGERDLDRLLPIRMKRRKEGRRERKNRGKSQKVDPKRGKMQLLKKMILRKEVSE